MRARRADPCDDPVCTNSLCVRARLANDGQIVFGRPWIVHRVFAQVRDAHLVSIGRLPLFQQRLAELERERAS